MELLRKWDCNVPTLRFSNKTIWEKKRIKDFCEVNPKTEELEDEFIYIDLESVSKGCLLSKNIISKTNAPSRAQRVLTNNDILFQCVRPYQMNNLLFNAENADFQYVASTGYAQIRTQENPSFVYHLLHSPNFNKEVMLRCTGSSYPAITSSDLGDIEVYICGVGEQQKIGHFLDLIDRRIAVQNKIISKYETLIKGLCDMIFRHNKSVSLSDLVKCKTSALQENTVSTCHRGEYKVLGASGAIAAIDTYQFEESGILVLKDGSKAGKIQFAQGKYSVVGTSVVLIPNEACDARYLYFAMSSIDFEKYKVGSGIPHIYFKDYSNERIYYPEKALRKKIIKTLDFYETRVEIEREMLSAMQKQKAFLLQSMFI